MKNKKIIFVAILTSTILFANIGLYFYFSRPTQYKPDPDVLNTPRPTWTPKPTDNTETLTLENEPSQEVSRETKSKGKLEIVTINKVTSYNYPLYDYEVRSEGKTLLNISEDVGMGASITVVFGKLENSGYPFIVKAYVNDEGLFKTTIYSFDTNTNTIIQLDEFSENLSEYWFAEGTSSCIKFVPLWEGNFVANSSCSNKELANKLNSISTEFKNKLQKYANKEDLDGIFFYEWVEKDSEKIETIN